MKPNRTVEWLIEVLQWILLARTPLLGLFIVFVACIICIFPITIPNVKIIVGLILQILGMCTALHAFLRIRKKYHPSIRKIVKDWLAQFPKWKKQNIIASGATRMGYGCYGNMERGAVWEQVLPSDTLEERIEKILINLEYLKRDQSQQISEIRSDHQKEKENNTRATEEIKQEFNDNLKQAFADDIVKSIVGLILLLVGVIISTLSAI